MEARRSEIPVTQINAFCDLWLELAIIDWGKVSLVSLLAWNATLRPFTKLENFVQLPQS